VPARRTPGRDPASVRQGSLRGVELAFDGVEQLLPRGLELLHALVFQGEERVGQVDAVGNRVDDCDAMTVGTDVLAAWPLEPADDGARLAPVERRPDVAVDVMDLARCRL